MRSTFSRMFFPAAIVLLAALLLVGTSFRALTANYLEEDAMDRLKTNATAIAELARVYENYDSDPLGNTEFLVNLTVSAQVSGADVVICDATGKLRLCSDAPFGCRERLGKPPIRSGFGSTARLRDRSRKPYSRRFLGIPHLLSPERCRSARRMHGRADPPPDRNTKEPYRAATGNSARYDSPRFRLRAMRASASTRIARG